MKIMRNNMIEKFGFVFHIANFEEIPVRNN